MAFRTCTWCGPRSPHHPKAKPLKLLGWLTPAEATRWADIKATFARNLRTSSGGQLLQVLTQLENISGGIGGIREALGREYANVTIPKKRDI